MEGTDAIEHDGLGGRLGCIFFAGTALEIAVALPGEGAVGRVVENGERGVNCHGEDIQIFCGNST